MKATEAGSSTPLPSEHKTAKPKASPTELRKLVEGET